MASYTTSSRTALGWAVEWDAGEPGARLGAASLGQRPSGLTRREREVAALVARGLTNRQIGEALVITEGTVNLHVKHILGKLGFASRAQIAAWFVREDLAAPRASPPLGAGRRPKDIPRPGRNYPIGEMPRCVRAGRVASRCPQAGRHHPRDLSRKGVER